MFRGVSLLGLIIGWVMGETTSFDSGALIKKRMASPGFDPETFSVLD